MSIEPLIEPVEWVEGLPEAIIVDMDGTLAHIPEGGRSIYDYDRVHEDVLDEVIFDIVYSWQYEVDTRCVLIVSGRDDSCYGQTKRWLFDNDVFFDRLLMRPTGNTLPDYVVKYNIFHGEIRGKYNVRFVLDDRKQVVDMWRELGLKCLQVAPGEF
jgi:hypothetical protein